MADAGSAYRAAILSDCVRYSERPSLHDVRNHAPVAVPREIPWVHNAAKREFDVFGRTSRPAKPDPTGGARRDRTDDLLLAKQALSQLSYGPSSRAAKVGGPGKI